MVFLWFSYGCPMVSYEIPWESPWECLRFDRQVWEVRARRQSSSQTLAKTYDAHRWDRFTKNHEIYWDFIIDNHHLLHHIKITIQKTPRRAFELFIARRFGEARPLLAEVGDGRNAMDSSLFLIGSLWWTNILPWKITIFNGKTHYFYGHFPLLC